MAAEHRYKLLQAATRKRKGDDPAPAAESAGDDPSHPSQPAEKAKARKKAKAKAKAAA